MFKDSDFDDLDDLVNEGIDFVQEKDVENQGVSTAAPRTPPIITTIFDDEDVTMALTQTLIKIKEEKAKAKVVAIKEVEDSSRPIRSITTLQPLPTIDPKDKGKGVLVEEEPEKPENVKRRDQGLAQIEKFDEIQARMDVNHELAVRLTHKEQEKYTNDERATLLAEYFERRKKQLAAKIAKAIRNKPPTRAQVRNMMFTYLNHMEDCSNTKKTGKRIKRIADSTSKQKSPKISKVIKEQESTESNAEAAADYEQEKEELRMWLAVVPNEDETVDPALLSVKYHIVDWESQNLRSVDMEDIYVYKIIRADRNTNYHKTFSSMLRKFDRQDLMDLHTLVMKSLLIADGWYFDLLQHVSREKISSHQGNVEENKFEEVFGILPLMFKDVDNEETLMINEVNIKFRGRLLGIIDFYNLVLLVQLDTAGDDLFIGINNWETATYGKVRYFKDIDYFKDFETNFPAIVYKDALTSEPGVSSEPTVSAHHVKKVDFDFVISFDESDDEDYTFTYDKNSFSYKVVSVNDLKSYSNNDNDEINIKQASGDIFVEPLPEFWSTVKAKTVNVEVQLHALVDGKKIIITESTVRRDLQLEDAEGVDSLPNATIFE
ncbi:hypothetical protein Tco_0468686 [Tanacetum coccineum]